MPTPIVRIEAKPRLISDGTEATIRMAGGGDRAHYRFGGVDYRAGILQIPRFSAAIGFDENGWTGGVAPQTGSISWAPSLAATLASFASNYLWIDAPITVELGFETDAGGEPPSWSVLLQGNIASMESGDGQISFVIADLSDKLAKPMLSGRFAGTGGIEGPVNAAQRVKRLSFGYVFNVEGRILDAANSIFEFGDPASALASFSAVRDMGRAASPAPAVLAWQGSIAATFAALQASSPVQGSGVVAPSISCVKWWTTPVGPLTADIVADWGGGSAKPADIARRILERFGGISFHEATFTAANAARTELAGAHISDPAMSWANAVDRVLMGSSLIWIMGGDGLVYIRPIEFGASAGSYKAEAIKREEVFPPVKNRRLGYQRNERQHQDGEIAASLLLADLSGAGDLAGLDAVEFGSAQLLEEDGTTIATQAAYRTDEGIALGIYQQGILATRSRVVASLMDQGEVTNIVPDGNYNDLPGFWNIADGGQGSAIVADAAWASQRLLYFNGTADFEYYSDYFQLEVGAVYRVKCRIWNNAAPVTAGYFQPLIHMPGVAWWSLKHGSAVTPGQADAANAIIAAGDTGDQNFYFRCTAQAMRQIQFRLLSTLRGTPIQMFVQISKVPQLSVDILRGTGASPYTTAELETILGTALAITNQAPAATDTTIMPGATRNVDGANMLPSPILLDRSAAYDGGTIDTGPAGAGRQLLYGKRARLPSSSSHIYWDVTPQSIPVIPGDYLFAAQAAMYTGVVTTDYIFTVTQFFGSNGTYLSGGEIVAMTRTGTQLGAADTPQLLKGGFLVPDGAAYVRLYSQRIGGAQAGVLWASEFYLGRSEQGADITRSIEGTALINVQFDYTSTVLAGEYDRTYSFRLFKAGVALTAGVAWSITTLSGTISRTITGTGTGVLTITSLSSNSRIRITGTHLGLPTSHELDIVKVIGDAPTGGGGGNPGTTGTDPTIDLTNSTSYGAAKGGPITVKAGTAGTVNLTAPLAFDRFSTGSAGAYGKWQWRVVGGSWADCPAGEITYSQLAQNFPDTEVYEQGLISVTDSKTGLTSGTDYEFQLLLRGSVTQILYFDGTATAAGV